MKTMSITKLQTNLRITIFNNWVYYTNDKQEKEICAASVLYFNEKTQNEIMELQILISPKLTY